MRCSNCPGVILERTARLDDELLRMEKKVPWVRCPTVHYDLNQTVDQRFRETSDEIVAQGRRLPGEV